MKTRNGFVSNSSSSSFIIGYAVVTDRKKFADYISLNDIEINNFDLKMYDIGFYLTSEDRILTGGNYTEMLVPQLLSYNDPIFTVQILNDEGDEAFTTETTDYELDYEIANDISYYSKEQQATIRLFDQPFVGKHSVKFGAERNG